MTTDITARVARGAALLDEREPGWWQRIDLERLDLGLDCRCVLGQLHSDYAIGERSLLLSAHASAAHGFLAEAFLAATFRTKERVGCLAEDETAEYHDLTDAWRELITARRAEVGA